MPRKPAAGTAVKNPYAPHSDRLFILYGMNQTTGVDIPNLCDNTMWTSVANFNRIAEYASYDFSAEFYGFDAGGNPLPADDPGVGTDLDDLWGVDADEGEFANLNVTANGHTHFIRVLTAPQLVLPGTTGLRIREGTLLIRFKNNDNLPSIYALQQWAGPDVTTSWLKCFMYIAGFTYQVRVIARWYETDSDQTSACVSERFEFDVASNAAEISAWNNDWHTLIIRWGDRDIDVLLDGASADNINNPADASEKSLWITGSQTASGNFNLGQNADESQVDATFYISMYGAWDIRLSDDDVAKLFADPYISIRPSPQTEFWTVCPQVGRPTTTTAVIRVTTRNAAASTLYLRIRYSTTIAGISTGSTTSVVSTSGTDEAVDLSLTGLTPGTEYYYQVEWSDDNFTTTHIFPSGIGRFVTQRATSDTDFTFALFSDDHLVNALGGGAPNYTGFGDVGYGVDLDRYRNVQGSDVRKWQAASRIQRDIAEQKPDFIVSGGDFWMIDNDSLNGTIRPSSQADPIAYKAATTEWKDLPSSYLERAASLEKLHVWHLQYSSPIYDSRQS